MSLFGLFSRQPKSPSGTPAPAGSRVVYSEYRVRIVFRNVSQTRVEPWIIAPTVDEALALARRRYPTAASVEFPGEVRDIPEAESEAHRARQTGAAR
jgi:hypothetical protein